MELQNSGEVEHISQNLPMDKATEWPYLIGVF